MSLQEIVHEVQNPAFGGTLIWRFIVGYAGDPKQPAECPLQLVFLVLPVMFHEETYQHLNSTRVSSGLAKFAEKFAQSSQRHSDLLLAIHERIIDLRGLTLNSLQVVRAARLVSVNPDGVVRPLSRVRPKLATNKYLEQHMRNAEKFGRWCSDLTLHEISSHLKVRF